MGDRDHKILDGNKEKNYLANMLKKYYAWEDEKEIGNKKENLKLTPSVKVLLNKKHQA